MIEKKIRLLQVARMLGVGLATITDSLAKKGITIANSPNTPITPEVYEVINREFGRGRPTGSAQNIRERIGGLKNGKSVSMEDFGQDIPADLAEINRLIGKQKNLIKTLIKAEYEKRGISPKKKKRQLKLSPISPLPQPIIDAQNELAFLEKRRNLLREAFLGWDESFRTDEVPWSFITFHDRYISILPTDALSLKIPVEESKASFNFIKKAIEFRLPPIKIKWNVVSAKIANRPHFDEVLAYMVCRENLSNIFVDEGYDYRKYYNSIPAKLSPLFFPKSKTEYIDFLCETHSPAYRIVPLKEMLNNTEEDAFLFTVEREGVTYIVWENTNLSRATYVFRIDPRQYDQRLQFIFDYIVSNVRAKRQRLHSDSIDRELFGDFEIINHTEIGTWRLRLDNIISKGRE